MPNHFYAVLPRGPAMRLFKVPKPAPDLIRGSKFKVEEQSAWKLRFLVVAVAAARCIDFKVRYEHAGAGEMKRK
jgi:hypothetical protein